MPSPRLLLLSVGLSASAAWAQTSTGLADLCHDTTGQDRQAAFSASSGLTSSAISLVTDSRYPTGTPTLRLNTNLQVLDTEHIFFPFDQQVTVSYLYESAGNSAALGYFYYSDLISRGYINTNGTADTSDDTLVDSDGNGISDFHEDLYGLSTNAARNFSSTGRRCTRTFSYTYNSKSYTAYEPELALNGTCDKTYNASAKLADARAGAHLPYSTTTVGSSNGRSSFTASEYGDQGLYPTIPNLLEPRDPANSLKGLGHFIFMHADDDGDTDIVGNLAPTADVSTNSNGIPDYNVSAYEDGRLLATPPDNLLDQENDRTVNLGVVQGNQEVVFFLVAWGGPSHAPPSTVYPCLRFNSDGSCALHLISPTGMYFSKTLLNLDQNPIAPTAVSGVGSTVATRDIGCAYGSVSTGCVADGWLDQATLDRMKALPAYNNMVMPHEKAYVKADPSGRGMMPHAFMGAPSTDKYRWILGFEDLPGGGDRDFNDVTFMIHKSNGGQVRSAVVSGDLSPSISQDYTISEVTFRAVDDTFFTSATTACSSYATADLPHINYQVALDCKVCTGNCSTTSPILTDNPFPTWVDVPLNDPPPTGLRDQTVVMRNFLERGLTGSQLCWQAVLQSKNDQCQPTIVNIDVSYKAVKSGDYGRAAVSSVANTVLYGTFETRGKKWFDPAVIQPSTRVIDQDPDLVNRGHVYLKELFSPENPITTTGTKLWDSGSTLSTTLAAPVNEPNGWRKLITMSPSNQRVEIKDVLTNADGGEAFNTGLGGNCAGLNGGHYDCDLNGSGGPPDADDRALLRNWLYGWEKRTNTTTAASSDYKRTWPMGGVQLSTPAIIGGPAAPSWMSKAQGLEPANYKSFFLSDSRVSARSTVAYVGTTQGYLHAMAAGALKAGDDPCTSAVETQGYFALNTGTPSCLTSSGHNYGLSTELFAYLPRKLLPYYVNSYVRSGNNRSPQVDASPSVADVDLGTPALPYVATTGIPNGSSDAAQGWAIGTTPKPLEGAKTVLVSATGPSQSVVFSLDITDPKSTSYPLPMWEFDMSKDLVYPATKPTSNVESAFADAKASLTPDTRGSRHSPPIVRMDFGTGTDKGGDKWIAVVGTDYVPNTNAAGTLYLLDMKTGLPAQVPGAGPAATLAGVIPLAKNEGVAGAPAAVDSDGDGTYDLLYVATTGGKIFRINTKQVDLSRGLGRTLFVCKVADIQETKDPVKETRDPLMLSSYVPEVALQGVYSNIAVSLVTGSTAKKVRVVVGTANNPDIDNEPVDLLATPPHGYVLSFEDIYPTSTAVKVTTAPIPDCMQRAKLTWVQQLGTGQAVWGGVTAVSNVSDPSKDEVFTSTAVGKAAGACELSATDSGRFYEMNANVGTQTTPGGVVLNGHSLASPVVHDGHLIMLTADGKVMVRGDPTKWNNPLGTTAGPATPRVWDANVNGVMHP